MTPQFSSGGGPGHEHSQSVQQRWPKAAAKNQVGVVGFDPKAFFEQRIQWALGVGLVIAMLVLPTWKGGERELNSDGRSLAVRTTGVWSTAFIFNPSPETPASSAPCSRQKLDGDMDVVTQLNSGQKRVNIHEGIVILRELPELPRPIRTSLGRNLRPVAPCN